jgi:hypothetical protein
MNFKDATDGLFDRIDHAKLAEALGVSVASIRQARLNRTAKAYREPPSNWEEAIIRMAQERVAHFQKLAQRVASKGVAIYKDKC